MNDNLLGMMIQAVLGVRIEMHQYVYYFICCAGISPAIWRGVKMHSFISKGTEIHSKTTYMFVVMFGGAKIVFYTLIAYVVYALLSLTWTSLRNSTCKNVLLKKFWENPVFICCVYVYPSCINFLWYKIHHVIPDPS